MALQVEGSSVWYHLKHCTRAIDNRLDGKGGSDNEPDGEAADVAGPSEESAATADSHHPAEDDVQTNADTPSSNGSAGDHVVDAFSTRETGEVGAEGEAGEGENPDPAPFSTVSGTSPPLTSGICCTGGLITTQTAPGDLQDNQVKVTVPMIQVQSRHKEKRDT